MILSRKVLETAFILSASTNSNFQTAFSKAQKEMSQLNKEIQALNKSQGSIAAFQKQQTAAENTRKKLETLQRQYVNVQKEINGTEKFSSDLENKLLSKREQIKKTYEALQVQTERLQKMGEALKAAGVDTDHLTKESEELEQQIKALKDRQEELGEKSEAMGELSGGFETARDVLVNSGLQEKLGQLADAYQECVTMSREFEASMSNVEALSGASASEIEQLSAMAKELGATTVFTAKDSADAMGYMAMAGWDTNDMLAGMNGVLQLAAASGEDLAMVSDIVTDSLSAFGLTAADSAHFSDVLAAAATSANTNVSIMGETFKQSASVAGALGYSIEDVAVAVGLMANSGVKGSRAGTALKNTFNGLLEGVTLTSAAFGEYEYSAVKADGTMKDFGSTIDELRSYFEQMTEAERVSNAMAIAGQEGYNGLLSILNASNEDYTKLTMTINNCTGAAERMAAVKLDNLSGDMEEFNSAMEGLQITLGEQANPALRMLYQTGAELLGLMDQFAQDNPGAVQGILTAGGAMLTLTAAVSGFVTIMKVAQKLQLKSLFVGVPAQILGIGAGLAALTGIIVGTMTAAKESVDVSYELTAVSKDQYDQLQALNAEYEEACALYGENSNQAQNLRREIETLSETYENEKQLLDEYLAAHEALIASYNSMAGTHNEEKNSLADEAAGIQSLIDKTRELAGEDAAGNQDTLVALIDELSSKLPGLNITYADLTGNTGQFVEKVQAAADAQAEQLEIAQEYREFVDRVMMQDSLQTAVTDAEEQVRLAQAQYDAAYAAWEKVNAIYEGSPVVSFFATSDEAATLDAARSNLMELEAALEEATAAYEENETAIAATEESHRAYQESAEASKDTTEDLAIAVSEVAAQMDELSQAYTEAYNAAEASVSGQYELWDKAAQVVTTKASDINKAMESQVTYWQNYNTNLQTLQERAAEIEGLSDVIASFADGSADSVNAVAGMAKASDEELQAMVSNFKALQEQQDQTAENIAELVTDFENQMDLLQQSIEDDVENMNLSDEALDAGEATIRAYISAAEGMLPQVAMAYSKIAQAAQNALGTGSVPVVKPGTNQPYAYAEGTTNAARGWAWVGENGPELRYMRGGETIVPADVSAAAAGAVLAGQTSNNSGSPVSVVFQISGDVTAEVVDRLQTFGDEFAERVRQVVEDIRGDNIRRAYA